MLKRTFDVAAALAALVVASPLLVLIAIAIKIKSPGPVFYRGVRVGRYGRRFRILKFRTMVIDAEARGGSSTSDGDPRITRVGRFLRKRKLDELPQLVNILLGDMSFVGPRPEVQQYVAEYTEAERQILTVRPGMTDFATLWNADEGALLAGSADPDALYYEKIRPEKLRLQLEYVRRQSFRTDMRILWKTIVAVIGGARPAALDALTAGGRRQGDVDG